MQHYVNTMLVVPIMLIKRQFYQLACLIHSHTHNYIFTPAQKIATQTQLKFIPAYYCHTYTTQLHVYLLHSTTNIILTPGSRHIIKFALHKYPFFPIVVNIIKKKNYTMI